MILQKTSNPIQSEEQLKFYGKTSRFDFEAPFSGIFRYNETIIRVFDAFESNFSSYLKVLFPYLIIFEYQKQMSLQGRVQDYKRDVEVLQAELKIRDPINGSSIIKRTKLLLTLFNIDEQINHIINLDVDVYDQYFRVKGTEVIDEARKACEQNKNEDAQKLIDNMLIQIQKNYKVASQCSGIIQDLQQAKQASQRSSYGLFGQKQMCQMVSNNYQQQGVNSLFSAEGVQLQQPAAASYQNCQQQTMMFQVQRQKPPNKHK